MKYLVTHANTIYYRISDDSHADTPIWDGTTSNNKAREYLQNENNWVDIADLKELGEFVINSGYTVVIEPPNSLNDFWTLMIYDGYIE